MVIRETDIETVSSEYYGLVRLKPESIRIKLEKFEAPKDVGAFAYAEREYGIRLQNEYNLPIKVNINSLLKHRRAFVQNLLDKIHMGTWTDATIDDYYTRFEAVIQWFNTNNHTHFLENVNNAKKAYMDYSNYLRNSMQIGKKKGGCSVSYSFRHQMHCRKLLSIAFPDDYKNIVTVTTTIKKPASNTEVPSEKRVKQLVEYCIKAFEEISEHLLSNIPYPWYLQHVDWKYYVFPADVAFETPFATKLNLKKTAIVGRQLSCLV